MNKLIKYSVYFVITIVVAIALAIGSILLFVNPNQFKPQITELVQKQANIVVDIKGDIEWTFYPWLGLKVQDVSIASPYTPTVPLANIQMLQAAVLLKSLINKELNVSDVIVNGLNVSLLKDANGNSNWVIPTKTEVATTVTSKATESATVSAESSAPNLFIQSITVNNANFMYKDAQNNQALALKNLMIKTGEVVLNEPISLTLSSRYELFEPKVEGNIELSSIIDFNVKEKQLGVQSLNIKNSVNVDNEIQLTTNLTGAVTMDLAKQLLQLSNLSIQSSGKIANFNIQSIDLNGIVKADLQNEIVNVDNLEITMDDLVLKGKVIAEHYSSDQLQFDAIVNSNTFNLKALLTKLQIALPEFSSTTALQQASVELSIKGDLKNIDVSPLNIHVDETTVTGSGAIILGEVPTVALALSGDQLIIDHYLPRQKASVTTKQSNQSHATAQAPSNPEISPVLPKDVNVITDIQWKSLILDQLLMTNNHLKGSLKNGDLTLNQLSTNMYGGTVTLDGSVRSGQSVQSKMNGKITDLNLGEIIPKISLQKYINNERLLARLNQNHQDLSVVGLLNSQFSLSTAGRLQNDIVANLNGTGSFELSKGRINNFNYEKLMCQGIALLNRKQLTGTFTSNFTDFQKLAGNFVIRNGVVNNDALQMIVPGLIVNGKGDVNLNRMTVNYVVGATLTGDQSASSDPACQINERFKGIALPIICSGSLEKTEGLCRIDMNQLGNVAEGLLKNEAKKKLDQQKDKLQDKLENKLDKELNKNPAIKGLLKNLL